MSSSLCGDNHFQFIANQLTSLGFESRHELSLYNWKIPTDHSSFEETVLETVNSWKLLNYYALEQRYDDKTDSDIPLLKHTELKYAKPIQLIKALECLRYQCSEGDAIKKPSYNMLEKTINFLMMKYIHALPEYDKAEWEVREVEQEKLISLTDMMTKAGF